MNLKGVQTYSIQAAVQYALDKLDRGKIVFGSRGDVMIQCKKHELWVDASYSIGSLHGEETILDYLIEAFDRCPGCIEEKQWAATRFPETAEL